MSSEGRLFVVATPIGCLEDITLRALRILNEADTILAEDTRRTRILCQHHSVGTRLRSFHAHSPDSLVVALVEELEAGGRLAMVTDAGTPIVSDPGARLVAAATEAGVEVEVIPGPSAVTAALSVAAIPCDSFRFVGFLPRSGAKRKRALVEIAEDESATVLFESPRRIRATLADLAPHLGDSRTLALCRELTKVHQEVVRGSADALLERLPEAVRGEITLVIEGRGEREAATVSDEEFGARAREWRAEGLSSRDISRRLAETFRIGKREAYQRLLALSDG